MTHEIMEWVKTILLSIAIAFLITLFVRPTLVKGYSMYPTLEPNNYLVINKIPYTLEEPSRGDIVVFKSHLLTEDGKEKDLIKRVIAVPGDHLVIESGRVYVNDVEIDEPYINGSFTRGDLNLTIPCEKIFVMGDNREKSMDSRDSRVGPVNLEMIRGKVIVRLFPFDEIGSVD
ncbi:MAG: signal peptidase I [Peptostreptococcaceae bacterium]|nr:signal peptidase I [Peptostreptococcaceae bacterium]